jgi:hypothetical protein
VTSHGKARRSHTYLPVQGPCSMVQQKVHYVATQHARLQQSTTRRNSATSSQVNVPPHTVHSQSTYAAPPRVGTAHARARRRNDGARQDLSRARICRDEPPVPVSRTHLPCYIIDIDIYIHTHTYIHAHIHTYIHTYIYIHIYIYVYASVPVGRTHLPPSRGNQGQQPIGRGMPAPNKSVRRSFSS